MVCLYSPNFILESAIIVLIRTTVSILTMICMTKRYNGTRRCLLYFQW
jgi:hypothetical protein